MSRSTPPPGLAVNPLPNSVLLAREEARGRANAPSYVAGTAKPSFQNSSTWAFQTRVDICDDGPTDERAVPSKNAATVPILRFHSLNLLQGDLSHQFRHLPSWYLTAGPAQQGPTGQGLFVSGQLPVPPCPDGDVGYVGPRSEPDSHTGGASYGKRPGGGLKRPDGSTFSAELGAATRASGFPRPAAPSENLVSQAGQPTVRIATYVHSRPCPPSPIFGHGQIRPCK